MEARHGGRGQVNLQYILEGGGSAKTTRGINKEGEEGGQEMSMASVSDFVATVTTRMLSHATPFNWKEEQRYI